MTEPSRPPDLRVVLLAVMSWAGALAGFLLPAWVTAAALGIGAAVLAARRRTGHSSLALVAWLVAAAAVAGSAMLRTEANQSSLLAELARDEAFVTATVEVTADPLLRQGTYGPFVLVRARTLEVTGRGHTGHTRVPVLLIGEPQWRDVEVGATVQVSGGAARPDGNDLAAVISTQRAPVVLEPPGAVLDAAARVRAGIRGAVAPLDLEERTLIPALVVGDDQAMPVAMVEDFRTTGLTHLAAVSGTNLTLVVGFVLIMARWCGVRARGLVWVGAVGVVGFVLLARTEPSVVRAAAMGSVALIGMGSNGRERGTRALGVAVFGLLLFDPWLALSLGFVLSALATAGILFLAPVWRDSLMRWTPRWVAEAVSVPLAAQLVCTPVVAAISDQVSLVAVVANTLVAPVVGPTTVLGLVGGLSMLGVTPLGLSCGWLAGWCAWWIVAVAQHGARLPSAALEWVASPLSIVALSIICVGAVVAMPRLLARRRLSLLAVALALVLLVRPLPSPGWPPTGWVMVACDVGQGDGVVLNAGGGNAVVVDVGPDPVAIDGCLDRLGVQRLPVVVLTHFHADHVDGLSGALSDRTVGRIDVTALAEPSEGAADVVAEAEAAGIPVRVPEYGAVQHIGALSVQVVGPVESLIRAGVGEESSDVNNASVALVAQVGEVRIMLGGDMEPEAQRLLHRSAPQLRVDVVKVPHHGSRYQDPGFLTGLGARLAVISAGEGNEYGHPAPETVSLLEDAGMVVRRTDHSGDVAVVVVTDGDLRVATSDG
ncbi:MAG: DNA internalization-related competence protein ComEC/Rec2 [uncultured Nocardioidaceae bacterium]|uniref:DNA internalization-related competence protein ComEC/Rec2 n=1 Tax=uncultured Nocardioidaceae bacterium TaxID=253824 RepID=A0A6J4MIK4_9ACTN|nr:MAG: DNA internalization-related competence protein ComEC/Rec2 [uncultured Nocardioidaceae bacterium]